MVWWRHYRTSYRKLALIYIVYLYIVRRCDLKTYFKLLMSVLLILALLTTVGISCGGEDEEGKVTVVIGSILDMTGPASPALRNSYYAMSDLVRYYNDEELIPGVNLKLVNFDQMWNPSRDLPGYEWCKQQGAHAIYALADSTAITVKPFLQQDNIAVYTGAVTNAVLDPPGWVFAMGAPYPQVEWLLLKWISDVDWDWQTKGPAKVGYIASKNEISQTQERAVREYCEAHPDQFTYIDGFLVPLGTQIFTGEIQVLKDCDYINVYALEAGPFIRDFHKSGYETQFFTDAVVPAYKGYFIDLIGWDNLDGLINTLPHRWWNEQYPIIELAKEVCYKYHGNEAEEFIKSGEGYLGSFIFAYTAFFEIVRQAIEEVGAENFDGQAYYNVAVNYEVQLEGNPLWNFTETKRYLQNDQAIYQWRADVEDLVRISEWLPQPTSVTG